MTSIETSPLTPMFSFCLIDHDGRNVSDETYRGHYVLIFFGFTHCRVVCPRALAKLSAVLDSLGPLADRMRPIYVTVDPERDTPDAMRLFLQAYPRFTGLTGSGEQIDRAKNAFRVFAQRVDDPAGNVGYAHTAITYVMDPRGRFVSHFTDALSAEELASRLRLLLESDNALRTDAEEIKLPIEPVSVEPPKWRRSNAMTSSVPSSNCARRSAAVATVGRVNCYGSYGWVNYGPYSVVSAATVG